MVGIDTYADDLQEPDECECKALLNSVERAETAEKEIAALRERVEQQDNHHRGLKSENIRLREVKGIACLKHDLIHHIACGVCLNDMRERAEAAEERAQYWEGRCNYAWNEIDKHGEEVIGLVTKSARLRAVVEAVEWVRQWIEGAEYQACPWCGGSDEYSTYPAHKPECIRQAALDALEDTPQRSRVAGNEVCDGSRTAQEGTRSRE